MSCNSPNAVPSFLFYNQAAKTSFKMKFHLMLSQRTVEFVILCESIALLGRIVFKKAKLRLNCATVTEGLCNSKFRRVICMYL